MSSDQISLTWNETVAVTRDTSATGGFGSVLLDVAARQLRNGVGRPKSDRERCVPSQARDW